MIYVGDCREVLKTLEPNSVDAVVTDPPYGLSFMGKHWDYEVPSVEVWKEVMRVLKPGGHLLSFAGTRTYHRMAVNIEDAGFEVRDMVSWIYGQGFPKSLDISKAFDKAAGAEREVLRSKGFTNDIRGSASNGRGISGPNKNIAPIETFETAPATDLAKQWEGWGTALKPALEPICLARKPLVGTVVENVEVHGTGGLNIDACRIPTDWRSDPTRRGWQGRKLSHDGGTVSFADHNKELSQPNAQGRWPSNVILDEEAGRLMDEQSGELTSGANPERRGAALEKNAYDKFAGQESVLRNRGIDKGGASRFFYVAKVSSRERNAGLEGMPDREGGIKNSSGRVYSERDPHKPIVTKNHHPTVKPVKLMEYLCKLVTPPGGIVLDPFMGSGSTGIAARNLKFRFIGIEREPEYAEIARLRIELAEETNALEETEQPSLFPEVANP